MGGVITLLRTGFPLLSVAGVNFALS
jgi:hypothetical protein